MKIAYFDAPTGLAGNMILGALVDAGIDIGYLKKELLKLQNPNFKLQNKFQFTRSQKCFEVKTKKETKRRVFKDILKIINRSCLSSQVKKLSARIFLRLAKTEATVHGLPINQVHFHEVGAIDAIIDIVGTAICLEKLEIEKVYCSPLPFGKGTIKHAHGLLPNPAPATVELLKGVPTYGTDLKGELVTPTGAAIITTICQDFSVMPRLELGTMGCSAGSKKLKEPNLLRVFIGEAELPTERDAVLQIETNIDDMNPNLYAKAIAKLMKAGALDAYITPIMMKKERQGVNLVILCRPEDRDRILDKLFTVTTVLGTRIYLVGREKLKRKFKIVKTKYGKAKIKVGLLGKAIKTIAPEFEDLKTIAQKHHLPIANVRQKVLNQYVH